METFFLKFKKFILSFLPALTTFSGFFFVIILVVSWPQNELDAGSSYMRWSYGDASDELKKFTKRMKNIRRVRTFGNETILYDAQSDFVREGFTVLNQNGYTPLFLYKHHKGRRREALFGVFPSLFTNENNKAIVLGLGGGITASVVADLYDFVKVFEINSGTAKIMPLLKFENRNLVDKENVEIVIQDGFIGTYLEEDNSYDAIISTLSNTTYYSASKLYSREYFEIAKQKLTSEGVFAIWYDSRYALSSIDMFYNTLKSVFNECKTFLLNTEYHLLICGENLKYQNSIKINTAENQFVKELVSRAPYLEVDAKKYFGIQKYSTTVNTLNKLLTGYKTYVYEKGRMTPFINLIEEKIESVDKEGALQTCEALVFLGNYWKCHCVLNPKECCPRNQTYCLKGIYKGQCREDCNLKILQ